jgi:hypothetical protein
MEASRTILSILASVVGGGLAGAYLNIVYQRWAAEALTRERVRTASIAMMGMLEIFAAHHGLELMAWQRAEGSREKHNHLVHVPLLDIPTWRADSGVVLSCWLKRPDARTWQNKIYLLIIVDYELVTLELRRQSLARDMSRKGFNHRGWTEDWKDWVARVGALYQEKLYIAELVGTLRAMAQLDIAVCLGRTDLSDEEWKDDLSPEDRKVLKGAYEKYEQNMRLFFDKAKLGQQTRSWLPVLFR